LAKLSIFIDSFLKLGLDKYISRAKAQHVHSNRKAPAMSNFQSAVALIIGTTGQGPREILTEFPGFDLEKHGIITPYGPIDYWTVKGNRRDFYLLDRHHFTRNPRFPNQIRASPAMYFLTRTAQVRRLVSDSAVGVYKHLGHIKVGDLVVPDSFMDLRGEAMQICPEGRELPTNFDLMLGHCPSEGLICPAMKAALGPEVHQGNGWLACTTGPLFEPDPEKRFYLDAGASFLGMHTVVREWKWTAWLKIHFLPILHVTNIISIGEEDTGEKVEEAARNSTTAMLEQFFKVAWAPGLDCSCEERRERGILDDLPW
jgi:purine nucleoside phosphorylase